jgi:sodium/proline symporter
VILTLGICLLYFAGLLLIGYLAGRKGVDSVERFYVADRSLGTWVVAFSARATGESGWLLLGVTGMGYLIGAKAFWIVLGELMGEFIAWTVLVRPFKAATDRYGSVTVPDYLESRFKDSRHILRWISAVVIVTMVVAYLSAQLTATGKAFQSFLEWDFAEGAIVGLLIVVVYTVAGGFRAVAWSDLLQGLMMVFGLVLVPIIAIFKLGGWGVMEERLLAIDPALLTAWGAEDSVLIGLGVIVGLMGPGLGFLGSPQLFVRFIAVKSRKKLRAGAVIAVIFTILTDCGAVLSGMAGRALLEPLADHEAVYPTLVNTLFGPVLTGLLVAVVLAAIMSTADSLLILSTSAVVRDVYQKILHPDAPQRLVVLLSRALIITIGALSLVFALLEIRLVYWFVLFAWAGIAAAFCPVIILSLFYRKMNLKGAVAAMLVGFLTAIVWNLTMGWFIYEMVPAFAFSLLAGYVVSKLTASPQDDQQPEARGQEPAPTG